MKAMFNNKIKINILFYFTILALELAMCSSVTIIIKDVNDKLLHIISYILKVSI